MNYPAMLATESAGVDVAGSLDQILDVGSSMLGMIQENPILLLYFVGGVGFIAIAYIRRLKK
ncbi:MAG: hypothetical protein IJ455_06190 [Agathobacter sp.]|nr:hypothetical protein [Agathobacter sp.]